MPAVEYETFGSFLFLDLLHGFQAYGDDAIFNVLKSIAKSTLLLASLVVSTHVIASSLSCSSDFFKNGARFSDVVNLCLFVRCELRYLMSFLSHSGHARVFFAGMMCSH